MRAYGRWNVTLPGETYVWDADELTVGENLMLEQETGQTYDQWISDLGENRAVACQILIWFLRHRAGRQEDRLAVDFPIRKLEITAVKEDEDPEASAGSEPATEPSSPSTTESDPGSGSS